MKKKFLSLFLILAISVFSFIPFANAETDEMEEKKATENERAVELIDLENDSKKNLSVQKLTSMPTTSHTVTFSTNGGTMAGPTTVLVNDLEKVERPEDPTRDGYVFVKWYSNSSYPEEFDFDTPITEDTTLFALFMKQMIYLYYDAGEGEGGMLHVGGQEVGSSYKVLTFDHFVGYDVFKAPAGKHFAGWNLSNGMQITKEQLDNDYYIIMPQLGNELSAGISFTAYYEDDTPTYIYELGAGLKYTISDNAEAKFKINADYSLFEDGGEVYVDDNLVDSSKYTSESGSTVITFTKDFMDSLTTGNHTLQVLFNNGGRATTTFTVENSILSSAEDSTTLFSTEKVNSSIKNPKTSDNIANYIIMLIISLLGFIVLYLNREKLMVNRNRM